MSDLGVGTLQDAAFVKGDWISDKANQAKAREFSWRSFQRWAYCRNHFKECVDIVLAQGTALPRGHQSWQMNEVNALIWPNKLGIGVIICRWKTTADIAYRFKVIKKPATRASYRTGPRQSWSQFSKKQGVDVFGRKWKKSVCDSQGGRKSRNSACPRLRPGDALCRSTWMSVLIEGGRVVTAADSYGDVDVDAKRIAAVGDVADVGVETAIDASGKLVLPGAVDPHTHLADAVRDDDDRHRPWATVDARRHDLPRRLLHPGQGSELRRNGARGTGMPKREGKALIDMGYHIAVTDLSEPGRLEELATLPDQGVTSYKLFMAYKGALQVDDETLFRTMEVAARTGCS